MASQSGNGGADSDAVVDPSDPGARLLLRIGDFVEPLTRFDRSHLSMAQSRHDMIAVMARQVFRVGFEVSRSEGNGPLPEGVEAVADAAALARETEGQLASARAAVPARLETWAQEHGEDPLARPGVADCFTNLPPLGHVAPCGVCTGSGKTACTLCKGAKELTCEACNGRGSNDCGTCGASGQFACSECHGMGTTLVQKQRMVWDEAINQHRTEYFQETAPCKTCNQTGKVKCDKCAGRGQLTCKICEGRKTVACTRCYGAGTEICTVCGGAGQRYAIASVSCAIKETFEVAARTSDSEIASVLKARGGIEQLLELASSHRATAEANNVILTRDTMASTPVTSVVISVGDARAMIRGYGAKQEVLDYKNIAGLLLEGDMAQLETALATTKLFPPRVNDALHAALSGVLASEANASIARTKSRTAGEDAEREFHGAMAGDYVKRAAASIRKAVVRAYWAGLARGPAAVLALPLLFAPLDLMMRGSGQAARLMVLLGVMLATFGAAAAAHVWTVRQLQKHVSPGGVPKLAPIVDRQGLTQSWLIVAGVASALLTLLIAGLTSALFPPN